MSKIIVLFLFFILLILQLTIMPRLIVLDVFPNILLAAFLAFVIIIRSDKLSLLLGLVVGLMMDLFSSLPFGIYSLSFVFIAWFSQFIWKNIFKITDLSGQIYIISLGSFFYNLLILLMLKIFQWLSLFQKDFSFLPIFIKIALPEFILNALVAIIFLFSIRKVYGLFVKA